MENNHWYAMYVKMHHEKKTAEKLYNMGINKKLPTTTGKGKTVE